MLTDKELDKIAGLVPGEAEAIDSILRAIRVIAQEAFSKLRISRIADALNNLFREVELKNKIVTEITVSPNAFTIIRSLGRDYIDESTSRKIIESGIFAHLWTADIRVDHNIDGIKITGTKTPDQLVKSNND
jgi:hypothetical protein